MKKNRYALVEDFHEKQPVYGLVILLEDDFNDAIELCRIRNITCDKASLEELIGYCNSLKLSPLHINDVIEDFLSN